MLDSFTNYFWQHPVAIVAAVVAVVIILIWMTGSGSRQRFVSFKRTKETDQLARDLSRIAAALERIARHQETPHDYVGRPIPVGWEDAISAGPPSEEGAVHSEMPPGNGEPSVHAGAQPAAGHDHDAQQSAPPEPPPTTNAAAGSNGPSSAREDSSASSINPLGGTAGLLGGKKKLDLPNPLYRPK